MFTYVSVAFVLCACIASLLAAFAPRSRKPMLWIGRRLIFGAAFSLIFLGYALVFMGLYVALIAFLLGYGVYAVILKPEERSFESQIDAIDRSVTGRFWALTNWLRKAIL